MTLEQEIRLAAKHAAQAAAKEAEKEKEIALKEAEAEKKMAVERIVENNARKLKESGVSVEIISKCTGLSLQQVQEL